MIKDGEAQSTERLIKVTATGSPEMVSDEISNLEVTEFKSLVFGRGYNLVHVAIKNEERPEVIRVLFENGANLDLQDDDGRTPLHHAIDADNAKAAKVLIELGAKTNIPNDAGFTQTRFCQDVLKQISSHRTCLVVLESN